MVKDPIQAFQKWFLNVFEKFFSLFLVLKRGKRTLISRWELSLNPSLYVEKNWLRKIDLVSTPKAAPTRAVFITLPAVINNANINHVKALHYFLLSLSPGQRHLPSWELEGIVLYTLVKAFSYKAIQNLLLGDSRIIYKWNPI